MKNQPTKPGTQSSVDSYCKASKNQLRNDAKQEVFESNYKNANIRQMFRVI